MGVGGLKEVLYGNLFQTFRHWGMHKEKKTLHFLLFYFSPSECLEQFIISSIAHPFLSGTVKCRLIHTLYIDCMV